MSFRRQLLLFTAFTGAAILPGLPALGQAASPSGGQPNTADVPAATQSSPVPETAGTAVPTAGQAGDNAIANITIKKQQLLLKQKDVTSAITEIGPRDIQAQGNQGSTQSLLAQSAPAIHVYQQGPGQNFPIISVRGVRGAELATTLDGVPFQDLIYGGQGSFENSNIGGQFDIEQIDGVTVYPGVAPPGVQGYGTNGGTLAYSSKKPTDERYLDVFGSIGSFSTDEYGFEANSGKIKELDNLKLLLRYAATESGGYVDNTQAKYRDMLFAFDKPYSDGLSKITGTVIYNNDFGYIQPQPTASNLLDLNGKYYNPPKSEEFFRQQNDYLSVILGDETYVNDYIFLSGHAFYLRNTANESTYENPNLFVPPTANTSYYYFQQNLFNFYGPGFYNGPGSPRYNAQSFRYDPHIYGDPNLGFGLNAQRSISENEVFGLAPKAQIFLPFNNITVGGLVARAKQKSAIYYGGTEDVPVEPLVNGLPPVTDTRAIYQVYFQDKIDLLDNKLHLEPGFTYEGAQSQLAKPVTFVSPTNPLVDAQGGYRLKKWNREILPYYGASYDLPYNFTVYGSEGDSALYAPLDDFGLGNVGSSTAAPNPAIAHAIEGGLRYNTDKLYMNLDYFYQKIDRAFGFFSNPKTQLSVNSNVGIEEFKGVEAAFKYRVTPDVTIFGNAAYVLAKYLQSYPANTSVGKDQFGFAFKGQHISGVPDWTALLGVDYTKKSVVREDDTFFARFFANYIGTQETTLDLNPAQTDVVLGNQTVAGGTLGAATTTAKNLPKNIGLQLPVGGTFGSLRPLFLFNAVFDYTMPINYAYVKRVKFELNFQNIFNTHYFSYYYNQYSPFAGNYSGVAFNDGLVAPPFSVTFTTTVRF